MAPNAPTGAARTMMLITPKNTFAAASIARAAGAPASPIIEMAKPVRIDDQQHLQEVAARQRAEERVRNDGQQVGDQSVFLGPRHVARHRLGIDASSGRC